MDLPNLSNTAAEADDKKMLAACTPLKNDLKKVETTGQKVLLFWKLTQLRSPYCSNIFR